jgi:hypothetical protein
MNRPTREQGMSATETSEQPRIFLKLPWGRAELIEEVTVESARADGQPVFVGVARLRDPDGSELVRFFYRSSGRVGRGPLTLRAADRSELRVALAKSPELRALLKELLA